MSRVIELVRDVWTFGCKGDVLNLADEAIATLDRLAERTASTLYKEYVKVERETKDIIEGEVVERNEDEAQKSLQAQNDAKAKADAAQKEAEAQSAADQAAADEKAKADAQTASQAKKNS